MYRLGIDTGGTFTDFLLSGDGVGVYKTPSTPDEPACAIENGLELIADDRSMGVSELLGEVRTVIHGTTVATNALIENEGAKTGLICTAGHEDSLEIRLGHKEDGHRYDFEYPFPEMLVPRRLRMGVGGRILEDGTERDPLDEGDVREAASRFREAGVESVAVSLVWSFRNAAHEERVREILDEELPGVSTSFSVDVLPQMREYTRTSTTVIDAYVKPILESYTREAERVFERHGYDGPIRYVQANGGIAGSDDLRERPAYAINSGPAAGPAVGRRLAERIGRENVITVDMGGTSFEISLSKGGSPEVRRDFDLLRYRMGLPMLQVETIGAGGGSIASMDRGLLAVGPESAGADPGPACYGLGGTEPTVTDAHVVLGYYSREELLGGRMEVDADAAREAIRERVAAGTDLSVEEAAAGIIEVANNNMVGGIRQVSIEKGHDPREFVLAVGGGTGPAHAAALGEELEIDTVLVPKVASVLCAYGGIASDYKYNYFDSYRAPIEGIDPDDLEARFRELERRGIADLEDVGLDRSEIRIERGFEMRYHNQIKECGVRVPREHLTQERLGAIRERFDRRHEELYTYSEPETRAELINIETVLHGASPSPDTVGEVAEGSTLEAARTGEREAYFRGEVGSVDAAVFDGTAFPPSTPIEGPAVVEEPTTTVVVPPGWSLSLDAGGVYTLSRNG